MPPNKQLQWTEFRDFSAGLWTEDDFTMPLGAASELVNYYPLPQGGLRAWFKRNPALSLTGIVNIAQERVVGLYVRGNVANRATSGTSSDRYLMTFNATDMKHRVYRMDETAAATTWSVIYTSAASTSATSGYHGFRMFTDSAGVDYVIFTIGNAATSDRGLYSVKYSDGTVTLIKAINGPFTVAQARIIGSLTDTLWWTDPGTLTIPADNFLLVEPNQSGAAIRLIEAFAPGDLLVGKSGAPWVNVQGDIESPTTFQMGGANPVGPAPTQAVITPDGLAYITYRRDLWLTANAASHQSLSRMLLPFDQLDSVAVTPGKGDFFDQWLMMPGGLVMDWETKAWFQASEIQDTGVWFAVDPFSSKMMVATEGVSFAIYEYDLDHSTNRNTQAWFKSGPIRNPDMGRQIEIREVQVSVKSWDVNTTVQVTVNGVTRTVTLPVAGKQTTRHQFVARGEELDVKVLGAAGDSANEAPIIEGFRVGWRPGHLTS